MVRAQGKMPGGDRDGKKKISAPSPASGSKKKSETGSWPCKMDGCKKVFAREADLKRHQRTTKTHSIPSFQCPQCDATFTRTDALRRHQKSRHNGVVIEPAEQDQSKHDGDGDSSGSRSPSPSGSRSQEEGSTQGSPTQSSSRAESSGRGGNYYRPHTMQDGYYPNYPPPRPPGAVDPHYPPPPLGIPTSATRGSWAPSTAPPPPWGSEGPPLPPPPPGMYYPSPYYPSPYYRHAGMPAPHMAPQISPELLAQSNGQPNGVGPPESALRNTSGGTPGPSNKDTKADGPDRDGPDESTLMAAAALQAVLAFQKEQEARARKEAAAATSTSAELGSGGSGAVPVAQPAGAGPEVVPVQTGPKQDAGQELSVDDIVRPEAELVADEGVQGVPILNPAELLTQVEHLLSAAEAEARPPEPVVDPALEEPLASPPPP